MLKIPEYNTITGEKIDLKELAKYDLEFYEYEECELKYQSYILDDENTQIIILDEIDGQPKGIITNPESYCCSFDTLEKIYDLIKDGYVVKE